MPPLVDTDREAIRQHLRAIEALLDGQDGDAAVVEEAWPPDPATINLRDGTWVRRERAAELANCHLDTIKRRIAHEDIAIKVGGKWWVNRARLLGCGGT